MLGKLGLTCSGETRYDQEHHEKESFFHLAEFYVACCVIFYVEKRSNSRSQMFYKMVFLKILQHLQENTCVGVSF